MNLAIEYIKGDNYVKITCEGDFSISDIRIFNDEKKALDWMHEEKRLFS
jgi:hypothetical protein